jgi:hypothetical protein
LNPAAEVYIHQRKYINNTGEQLVARYAGNRWGYEPFVDNVIDLIVGGHFNALTTLSGIPVMVMAHAKLIAINYAMFLNHFATNAVETAQIHSGWY